MEYVYAHYTLHRKWFYSLLHNFNFIRVSFIR